MGDLPGEAEALHEPGFVQWSSEDHGAALQHAREALALHRRMGDLAGEASTRDALSRPTRRMG